MIRFHTFLQMCFIGFVFFANSFGNSELIADEQIIKGQKFTLPDGLVIEEIASPTLVKRPICADFDEQGFLYIADSSGSNEKPVIQLGKLPHRIVRLEDSNNDGLFDKSVVFADKMMFPEGTLWHDGSLYVCAPPVIWKLTDTDEDGVADKREIWFDAKTLTGCANDLHGPYLGPDGWIYWCKGAFAKQTYKRLDGSNFVTKAAHIFRRRPEGGLIEPVMTGGMDNPVEVVFTPGGERLFSTTFMVHPGAGQRDGIIHAIYGGVYGKVHSVLDGHPRTGPVMPNLVHMSAAAPCGLLRVNSSHLGNQYLNSILTCSFNMHKITRNVLKPDGATYESMLEDFLVCDNLDFHPTDVLEDADGSLIVIDTGGWYKLCCPTSQMSKPDILGAVYRVKRADHPKIQDPRGKKIAWSDQTSQQLAKYLSDSRPAVRKLAKINLVKNGKSSINELKKNLTNSNSVTQRLEAVWTLTQIQDPQARVAVRVALQDRNETVRQAALHSISVHRDRGAEEELIRLLKNSSAHNRRAAAEALGRTGTPKAIPELLAAAPGLEDRVLEHSIIYAVIEIGDVELIKVGLNSPNPKVHRAAIIALDAIKGNHLKASDIIPLLSSENRTLNITAWWISNRHAGINWASQYNQYFRAELANNHTDQEKLVQLSGRLSRYAHIPAIQKVMSESLDNKNTNSATVVAIMNAMASSNLKKIPTSWNQPLLNKMLSMESELVTAAVSAVHKLSHSKPDDKFILSLNKIAKNTKLNRSVRLQALNSIPSAKRTMDKNTLVFLCNNLSMENPVRIRSLTVDVFVSSKLSREQKLVLAGAMNLPGPMELKRLVMIYDRLQDKKLGFLLVKALADNPALTSLSASELKVQLSGFGPEISPQTKVLLEKIEKENADRLEKIQDVLALIPQGDIRRGQVIFHSTQASCISCHGMGYLGGRVGPDLTRIGSIRNEHDLLESILFPSVSFVRSYEPVLIATENGKIYNGIIRNESDEEIHLQLDAEKSVRILQADIEERQSGKVSVMPQGLLKNRSAQDLADLIVFLKAKK